MVLLALVFVFIVRMPKVELNEEEKVESLGTIKFLLWKSTVWIYFVGIFCYVATEQGVSNWISSFLQNYHGVGTIRAGQLSVAGF